MSTYYKFYSTNLLAKKTKEELIYIIRERESKLDDIEMSNLPQKIITDLWEEDKEKSYIVHKCPKCFEIIDKDSKFCKYCGQRLREK